MSYTSDGQGWQPQAPYRMTRGDYMATGSQYFFMGQPGKLKEQGTSGASEYSKYIVERYDDDDGIEKCVGYCLRNLPNIDHAETRRLGMGGRRRDKRFMTFGEMNVVYVSGTNPAPNNTPLAPHPSGVQEWTPGKKFIGTMRQEDTYTGMVGYALINISQSNSKPIVVEETLTTWIDGEDKVRVAEFTNKPNSIQWINDGEFAFDILGTGATLAATEYKASVDYNTTTSGVILASGLGITTLDVRYEYF